MTNTTKPKISVLKLQCFCKCIVFEWVILMGQSVKLEKNRALPTTVFVVSVHITIVYDLLNSTTTLIMSSMF